MPLSPSSFFLDASRAVDLSVEWHWVAALKATAPSLLGFSGEKNFPNPNSQPFRIQKRVDSQAKRTCTSTFVGCATVACVFLFSWSCFFASAGAALDAITVYRDSSPSSAECVISLVVWLNRQLASGKWSKDCVSDHWIVSSLHVGFLWAESIDRWVASSGGRSHSVCLWRWLLTISLGLFEIREPQRKDLLRWPNEIFGYNLLRRAYYSTTPTPSDLTTHQTRPACYYRSLG